MNLPRPDPTVFYVRVGADGMIRSIGRTTASGFRQVQASFPRESVDEITEAEHRQWRGRRNLRMVEGVITDGAPPPVPASVEALRRWAHAEVDKQADTACARFMPGGLAQALDHLLTLDEAICCLDIGDVYIEEEAYPMLAAERAVRRFSGQDESLIGVALDVVSAAQICRSGLAQIKRVRRIAHLRIAIAMGDAAIRLILADLVWPQPLVG